VAEQTERQRCTKLAKAVQYCLNEKQYLYRCLEDGNVPVDNNRAENAIRPFAVGNLISY
jgi:hypothetical protein